MSSACIVRLHLWPAENEVKSSVYNSDSTSIEIVDEFCYLGHMSVDGDCDAAVNDHQDLQLLV